LRISEGRDNRPLLFSGYIGCFTATAKIIRDVVDIMIHIIGPNGTATIRGFNGTGTTFRGPPGLHNFRIIPEPNNTSK
jgi:hypothetical protein